MKKLNITTGWARALSLIAYLAMLAVNTLASFGKINEVTTADVSRMYDSLITPAGITFMIWFVIYALLGLFVFWELFIASDAAVRDIGISFAVTCFLNIGWIFAWHFGKIYLSTLIIAALFIAIAEFKNRGIKLFGLADIGFSIYEAWILFATIGSIMIAAGVAFDSFKYSILAQSLTCVALVLAAFTAYYKLDDDRDLAFAFTIVWALAGVIIRHVQPGFDIGFGSEYFAVLFAAIMSVAVVIAAFFISWGKRKGLKDSGDSLKHGPDRDVREVIDLDD